MPLKNFVSPSGYYKKKAAPWPILRSLATIYSMIIVEIKTKKQLRETPLLDLIDTSGKDEKYIGIKGMKADPIRFKKTTIDLYKNSRQNLVLILPSKEILKKIKNDYGLGNTNFVLSGTKPTSPTINEILKTKDIIPSSVHVLISLSIPFEGDFEKPSWAMVHDIIGHHLELEHKIDSDKFLGEKIFNVDDLKPYLITIGRALYAGVNEKFQSAGPAVKDDLTQQELDRLEYDELFNPDPPLYDDRWADILAAIALNEYDDKKVFEYLETNNSPNSPEWLFSSLRRFIDALREQVDEASQWLPGYTTFMRSW